MVAILPPTLFATAVLAVVVVGTAAVIAADLNRAYGLGVLTLLVFGLQYVGVLFPALGSVEGYLGLRTTTFLAGLQWWAPLTHMYLHAGLLHIFGNLFVLLTAGPTLEERIGSRAFLLVYFLAGLAGAASHVGLALMGVVPAHSLAVGASGAVFGVITVFAMLYPRDELPIPIFIVVWIPSFIVLAFYLGYNVLLIFTDSNVAWWAHFAGFLVGLAASARLEAADDPRVGAVDVEPLRPLATTEQLEEVLGRLESVSGTTHDDDTWTRLWLERFADRAACPACGADLQLEERTLRCVDDDWSLQLEERPPEDEL